jgi:hypothetical protein
MNNPENIELLTIDEYARRFRVCRTTIFEWKKQGKLQDGRHFIKIGRILRFFWNINVIKDLHNLNNEKIEKTKADVTATRKIHGINAKSTINFEY